MIHCNAKKFTIHGMKCGKCVGRVHQALVYLDKEATVTLDPPVATLLHDDVSLSQVNSQISPMGYSATELISQSPKSVFDVYKPLVYAAGTIIILTATGQTSRINVSKAFTDFMGWYYVVFSALKLINIKGFAKTYSKYDFLAMRIPQYGYVYPFVELALGAGYLISCVRMLTHFQRKALDITSILVMSISSLGIFTALSGEKSITCACMGESFKLPLSWISFYENMLMVVMSLFHLTRSKRGF